MNARYYVAMSPDNQLRWHAMPIPDANATLFLPGENPAHEGVVGDLLVSGDKGTQLHKRGTSSLYESPLDPQNIVLKEFYSRIIDGRDVAELGQVSTLRAHIMLAEGLDRIQQRGPWRIRGVRVVGALMLHGTGDATESGVVHARWAMERLYPEAGVKTIDYMPYDYSTGIINFTTGQERFGVRMPRLRPALPSPASRRRLYNRAITEVAGQNHGLEIDFDDHHDNMVIEKLPEKIADSYYEPGTAVKLDVQALQGFNF